jgi:hypothetical protein
MASIELRGRSLIVHIHGWDKLLALRSTLTIPLSHVTGVRARPPEGYFDDAVIESWRGIGTLVRGRVAAGTMQLPDGTAFYDVHHPERTVAIDVEHETVKHVVVEIDDEQPEDTVRRVEAALQVAYAHGLS